MQWMHAISYFFGGACLTNSIPHFVSGVTGHPFQSPFAKPPGTGLSSSTVNVLWGFFNLAAGYVLILQVGSFDLRDMAQVAIAGFGILVTALLSAHIFGRLHGGDLSGKV
jgi:hypothetical protein